MLILSEIYILVIKNSELNKLRGFSPPLNYTDRATAACQRS
jgi:hypothetical protein